MQETKQLLTSPPPQRRRRQPLPCSRPILVVVALVATAFIVALAVGLGVGLSRRSSSNNSSDAGTSSDSSSSSSSTMSPVPSVTSILSNHGFWQPPVNASWQIVLSKPLDLDLASNTVTPNVDVFDIDLFGNSKTTIDHLHSLGKHVICYFSAGSYEPNRPDSSEFLASDKGSELDGWPGEYWLNLNSLNVRSIMAARIKTAAEKGCDAIDPDNVDGYGNDNGLGLTKDDSIGYVRYLSYLAAQYNMSTGLKNAGDIIPTLVHDTHFSVNEQCVQYKECETYQPYIAANKPVFHIEYPKKDSNTAVTVSINTVNNLCSSQGNADGSYGFSTVIKNMDLDGWVQTCNGQGTTTPVTSSGGSSS